MVVAERTRWGIVFLALAAGIVSALHLGKAPPALPLMRPELGLGLISAGWVVTTFNFLALTIGMVTGVFADAMGRYRLLLIGLATLVAGGLLGSMAGGTVAILASRFVEGLGFVAISVAAPSLIGGRSWRRSGDAKYGSFSNVSTDTSCLTCAYGLSIASRRERETTSA